MVKLNWRAIDDALDNVANAARPLARIKHLVANGEYHSDITPAQMPSHR
jgi:hypothetical protein